MKGDMVQDYRGQELERGGRVREFVFKIFIGCEGRVFVISESQVGALEMIKEKIAG